MPNLNPEDFSCLLPIMEDETIQLAHGSGGRLSAELVSRFFLPRFGNETLNRLEDQAVVDFPRGRLALTTDSFVVDPLFFPGGDIGDLAINGTVNDVCMGGATPLYLAAAFIIEEGLPMATLHRILLSMEKAAKSAGVQIVTGDTKVVNRGCCDKLFITTTGVGRVPEGVNISAANLQTGDRIILSGTIADHGMAILTSREGLSFASRVQSDTAALNGLVARMLQASPAIHAMRDPTRGGARHHAQRVCHCLRGRHRAEGGDYSGAARGAWRMRGAGHRPHVCRQRGQAGGRCSRGGCRHGGGRHAEPSLGPGGHDYRRGRRGEPGNGGHGQRLRGATDCRYAGGRAAPQDLLNASPERTIS